MLTVGLGEPPASITRDQGARARALRRRRASLAPVTRARAGSTASSAAAASTTSACWRRWRACRASSSSPRSCATTPTRTRALPLAARPDRVAAVHGRGHLPGARPRGRRARARRRHRLGLRGRGAGRARGRGALDRAHPGARRGRARLAGRGRATTACEVHVGDGWLGLPEHAPYGGIAVAAAAPSVPEALWEQLREGARIVLPLGSRRRQELCAVERTPEGPKLILAVPARFVPLVRRRARRSSADPGAGRRPRARC